MGAGRPTKRRTHSAWSPRRARAAIALPGLKRSTSTPQGMVRTPSTSLDVNDARTRTQADDRRNARGLAPGEDVDLESEPPQVARDLPDVHVHAAGLLAAERGEGARVDGDEPDSRHEASPAAARRRSRTVRSVIDAAHDRRGAASPRTTD